MLRKAHICVPPCLWDISPVLPMKQFQRLAINDWISDGWLQTWSIFYNILFSTTVMTGYTVGVRNLRKVLRWQPVSKLVFYAQSISAVISGQAHMWQMAVSLQPYRQLNLFFFFIITTQWLTMLNTSTDNTKLIWTETELFFFSLFLFTWGECAQCLDVRFDGVWLPQS